MGLILFFWNISTPSWHKFYILEITLLSFELEVAIYSDIKRIEESVVNVRNFQVFETKDYLQQCTNLLPSIWEIFARMRACRTFHH
jgi:hypothetical protein